MKKKLAGALLLACLVSSCSILSRYPATSPARIPWGDYLPFARDLANPFELIEHPSLREAPIYHLSLEIANDLTTLDGRMSVRYTNAGTTSEGFVDFVLLPNIADGSMSVAGVRVDGQPAQAHLREGGIALRVDFPRPLRPRERAVVSMSYTIRIPTRPIVGFGGLLSSNGELSLGYAYPMIPASGQWNLGKPPAWGDLTANPVSFYLVELAYPKDLTLAAPGVTLARTASSERTHVLIAFGPARDLFIALGTELKLFFEHRDGILLRSFAPNAQSTASPSILDTAARALSVYEKAYGPYPYHELTFVGARFEAEGLEFPGMILLTSWLYQNARTSVDGSTVGVARELTVAHETAHQWFYALVGNNQITEPWIDESMAQYSTWLYWKNRYGGERAARLERSFQWEAAHDGGLPLGLPVGAYTPREYDLTIYGRGPLFILDLAHALGQGRFESYIRGIVEKYRFKVITGKELELSAESACGCSLAPLWSTWINGRSSRPR